MEDEGNVYTETVDENGVPTLVLDTETDQQLMMAYITKKDTEKYFVQPEEQEDRDEMETISSTKMEPGKSKPVATMVTTATTSVQISASEVMTSTEQEKITETPSTPKTLSVVELNIIPEEEINVEKDAQAS